MKIIAHRTDNTAYEKRVSGCVKFAERDGIDFYYTEGEGGMRKFYCRLLGTRDILKDVGGNSYVTPEQMATCIATISDQKLKTSARRRASLQESKSLARTEHGQATPTSTSASLWGSANLRKGRGRTAPQSMNSESTREARKPNERRQNNGRGKPPKRKRGHGRQKRQNGASVRGTSSPPPTLNFWRRSTA